MYVYIHNPYFAEVVAEIARPLDEHVCECCKNQYAFSLTGVVEIGEIEEGLFVGVRCEKCHHVEYTGDAQFMKYYDFTEEMDVISVYD